MVSAGAESGGVHRKAAGGDWRERIRRCLAGTRPCHDPESWLYPGRSLTREDLYRALFPANPVPAAVLVPIVEREPESTLLLTKRATQLKNHAGQVSFPGGRIEPFDNGPLDAALREAREEIGLDPRFVTVVGYLPDHLVISGYRVTPVVGFVRPGFELLLDAQEVEDTFEVPLSYLFDPANHRPRRRHFEETGLEVELVDIPYGHHSIWGATAGMLMTLYRLCQQEPCA